MTDASFAAAGYAVLIEDENSEIYITPHIICTGGLWIKDFTPAQIKISIDANYFLAIYVAFKKFGHILWGAPKPVIILTDNKAVTHFFSN